MHRALYGLTILLSALLSFSVQPMVGKALLPRLGGVPGVWTACLLFFQASLLVGYGYVWLTARFAPRVRVAVHLVAVALPLTVLAPFAFPDGPAGMSAADRPVAFALAFLALNVGLPFAVLSATSPLLAHWYSHVTDERPYFLYAVSNVGSLVALLSYPLLLEPFYDLGAQATFFRGGFLAVAACMLLVAWGVLRAPTKDAKDAEAEPITNKQRLRWVGLALLPTMLLAGSSHYVSLDLAPVPLLWVVPLAIYLLSFVVAFSPRLDAPAPIVGRATCLIAVVLVFVIVSHGNEPVWLLITLHLLFLGGGSWMAHRRLSEDAPPPRHLPQFFVWVALGGVSGTLISAVLAPLVLPDLWEYPVAIALTCLVRARIGVVSRDRAWKEDLIHASVTGGLVIGASLLVPQVGAELGLEAPEVLAAATLGPGALYAYRWMPLRRRYTLCLLAIVLAGATTLFQHGELRHATRSFFGVLRVVDQPDRRLLLHGTTLHGSQRLDQRDRCVPLTYYQGEGSLGVAFHAHRALGRTGRTFAIGLGTGAASCFAAPEEPWRFVEINPDVLRLAREGGWFTYLDESPGEIELALGDGRIRLEDEADGSLSLIFVDAFNSDAVPVHLLTREAIRLYLDKLAPGHWAILHVSNRALDLSPVVGAAVAAEGAAARYSRDNIAAAVIVAHEEADLESLDPERWQRIAADPSRAWTDDFSSMLHALQ
ncbi:MAG: hypothetical protein AB8I08_26865 [Sandaracinaceae bacterium]